MMEHGLRVTGWGRFGFPGERKRLARAVERVDEVLDQWATTNDRTDNDDDAEPGPHEQVDAPAARGDDDRADVKPQSLGDALTEFANATYAGLRPLTAMALVQPKVVRWSSAVWRHNLPGISELLYRASETSEPYRAPASFEVYRAPEFPTFHTFPAHREFPHQFNVWFHNTAESEESGTAALPATSHDTPSDQSETRGTKRDH